MDYARYLCLDELLTLQRPLSGGGSEPAEHDETLFIVVHQVYELWFKEILHEFAHLQRSFEAGDVPRALGTLKRVLTILKVLVSQLDVLETMTPLEFASFRERLASGSGLQSLQFREIEFVLGARDEAALERFAPGSDARLKLTERLAQPSLWRSFLGLLAARGAAIPAGLLAADPALGNAPSEAVQAALLEVYRGDLQATLLCERLVDLDEGLQEWRYRHVKMVERTIGTRGGTGGSAGAEYLRTTLFRPVFEDLWAIRSSL